MTKEKSSWAHQAAAVQMINKINKLRIKPPAAQEFLRDDTPARTVNQAKSPLSLKPFGVVY
jgi:hypothetical protein